MLREHSSSLFLWYNKDGDSMKNRSSLIIVSIILGLFVIFSLTNRLSKTSSAVTTNDTRREMLIDTAEAYLRKGNKYQYDQYRENRYLAPESINEYNYSYAVCSTFVFQVYYNTLGIAIPIKTENHVSNSKNADNKSIGYTRNYDATYFNNHTYQAFVNDIYNYVKEGDIIAFEYGGNGHTTMVYKKEDNGTKKISLIHNNGFVYDYAGTITSNAGSFTEMYEMSGNKGGSIYIDDLVSLMNKSYTGSNGKLSISSVAIVKILSDTRDEYIQYDSQNNGKGTPKAIDTSKGIYKAGVERFKYPKMDVEKTHKIIKNDCSSSTSIYANTNDEIEYSIKIKNNSNTTYQNMDIYEKISDNVSYSKNNGWSAKDSKKYIKKTIESLAPGKEVTLKYTVTVNSKAGNIESIGNINGLLPLKKIVIYKGNTLSKSQQDKIINNYNKVNFTSDQFGINYILVLYKALFNNNNLGITTDNVKYNNRIIKYDNSNDHLLRYTKIVDTSKPILANYYGLDIGKEDNSSDNVINAFYSWRFITDSSSNNVNLDVSSLDEYNNRARTINKKVFETGDILITDKSAYIYINGAFYKNGAIAYDTNTTLHSQFVVNGKTIKYDESSINRFLRDLVGKNYVVLRPALNMNSDTRTITYNANGGSNAPTPQTYTYSENNTCKTKLSSTEPGRTGYSFNGWSLKQDATSGWAPETTWPKSNNSNYTLYATWKPKTYSITYNANGGTGAPKEQTYVYSETGTINLSNTVPTRSGYDFNGWSRDKNATSGWKAGTPWRKSNASNYTLYATWVKASSSSSPNNDNNSNNNNSSNDDTSNNNQNNDSNSSNQNDNSSNNIPSEPNTPVVIEEDNQPVTNNNGNDNTNTNDNRNEEPSNPPSSDDNAHEIDDNSENPSINNEYSNNNPETSDAEVKKEENTKINKSETITIDNSNDKVTIKYEKIEGNKYKVTITAKEDNEFKEKEGFEISEDNKEITKVYDYYPIDEAISIEYKDSEEVEDINIVVNDNTFEKKEEKNKGNNSYLYLIPIPILILILILIIKKRKETREI